jgi:hypothetical protein
LLVERSFQFPMDEIVTISPGDEQHEDAAVDAVDLVVEERLLSVSITPVVP